MLLKKSASRKEVSVPPVDERRRSAKVDGESPVFDALQRSGVRAAVPYPLIVGTTIKQMREAAGLLQKDLAERAGMLQTGLSKIEAGLSAPDVWHLLAIAEALSVQPSEVLKRADEDAAALRSKGVVVSTQKFAGDAASRALGALAAPFLLEAFGAKAKG
jgi:transcriptional regulator with XRE-family HTH domain